MSRSSRIGKAHAVVLLALASVIAVATVAAAAAPTIKRISGNGGSGNQGSFSANMTGDGRFVVFNSYSSILVPGDTNATRDTFIYDRDTGGVERVNVTAAGQQANDESHTGFASADGRYVAFGSYATNLTTGDTHGYSQVYRKDLRTGALELVSVRSAADPGSGYAAGISGDGRYVLIYSHSPDLVPGDTNASPELFLRDLQAGITERLAVSGDGTEGDKGSGEEASLSPDARFVVFQSESTNLVPGDTNGAADIFLRDRHTGTIERVSVSTGGSQAVNGGSYQPSVSPDGRYVVFYSGATNLVPGDTNDRPDIFLRDRQTGTTTRASVTDAGEQAGSGCYDPGVSADGRYVVFASASSDLVSGDTNGQTDIFLRDRLAGTTTRLNVADGGAQATGADSLSPQISDDGRYVTFAAGAPDLVPGDTNGAFDVFLVDRGSPNPSVPTFTDIASSPYKAAIESLAGAGIINGYPVGSSWEFRPGNNLKRAQFAKMIVGSWGYPVVEAQSFAPFTDLGADDPLDLYPHEFVGAAFQKGITKGTTATTFGPYVNITRAQLITMVVRSMRTEDAHALPTPPAGWSGVLPGSDPTHGANIRAAERAGLLTGIDLVGWNVWGDATRGETAQILYNMRGM